MPRHEARRVVPYSPGQMYALVADVERYPEFLPLCESLQVRRRTPRAEGDGEVLLATMAVGYKAIRESFTSRVTLEPAIPRVLVEYVDGPFSHLENRWDFHAVPGREGACEVEFQIDYAFRSFLLQALMGSLFEQAFARFAEAFEERARAVYGEPSPAVPPPA
jgi:coenzyme Q-binding protein COQ10